MFILGYITGIRFVGSGPYFCTEFHYAVDYNKDNFLTKLDDVLNNYVPFIHQITKTIQHIEVGKLIVFYKILTKFAKEVHVEPDWITGSLARPRVSALPMRT